MKAHRLLFLKKMHIKKKGLYVSGCVLRNHDCGFTACTWPGLMVSRNVVTKVGVCETSVESISLFLKGCSIGSSGLSLWAAALPAVMVSQEWLPGSPGRSARALPQSVACTPKEAAGSPFLCSWKLSTLLVSHQQLVEHPPVNLQKEN